MVMDEKDKKHKISGGLGSLPSYSGGGATRGTDVPKDSGMAKTNDGQEIGAEDLRTLEREAKGVHIRMAIIGGLDKERLTFHRAFPKKGAANPAFLRARHSAWEALLTLKEGIAKLKNPDDAKRLWISYSQPAAEEELRKKDPILARMLQQSNLRPDEAQFLSEAKRILSNKDVTQAYNEFLAFYQSNHYDTRLRSEFADPALGLSIQSSLLRVQQYQHFQRIYIEMLRSLATRAITWNSQYEKHEERKNYYLETLERVRTHQLGGALYQKLVGTDSINQWLHYDALVQYLAILRDKIQDGMEQENWEDFNAFYENLEHEANHIRDLGESAIAAAFPEMKKRFHQYPVEWLRFIKNEISNKDYGTVCQAARSAIIAALRGERLRQNGVASKIIMVPLSSVSDAVDQRINKLGDSEKILKSVARRREKELLLELKETKKAFRGRQIVIRDQVTKFIKDNSVLSGKTLRQLSNTLSRLQQRKQQWGEFLGQRLRALPQHPDPLGQFAHLNNAFSATHRLEEIESNVLGTERKSMDQLKLFGQALPSLRQILPDLERGLRELLDYLRERDFAVQLSEKIPDAKFVKADATVKDIESPIEVTANG